MSLIRWEPFSWTRPAMRWPIPWEEEEWPEAGRDLTVYETDNELVVKANVSGVPASEVDVSIEGGVVTIKADHKETEEEKKKKKVVYREARRAQYLYTTSAPCLVVADDASAEVKDGVVTVTIPKAEEAKPKRIKVKAKGK